MLLVRNKSVKSGDLSLLKVQELFNISYWENSRLEILQSRVTQKILQSTTSEGTCPLTNILVLSFEIVLKGTCVYFNIYTVYYSTDLKS